MRLLTIVNDDSGLFVAQNMAKLAEHQGIVTYNALLESKKNREFVSRVCTDPYFDFIGEGKQLYDPTLLNNFDAVFFAKPPVGFPTFCRQTEYLDHPSRPIIIGAYPGLEFSPHRGFKNRLLCDVILFNTHWDLLVFQRFYGPFIGPKILLVGNPTLVNRWQQWTRNDQSTKSDVSGAVFLGQSITPPRLSERVQLLELLASKGVAVKIRQRPREGAEHVHRELFGYESLSRREGIRIDTVHCSMDEALRRYKVFLSCSSTGVPEAAAAGKHVGQVARFRGWEHDPLHLASLGYTLRHGLAVDEDALCEGTRPNSTFFSDFALAPDNALFALASTLRSPTTQIGMLAGHQAWKQALKVPTPEGDMALAYCEEGNPHKGSFLALAQLVSSNWEPSIRAGLDQAVSYLGDEDTARAAIDAVLSSQGSPGDLLRMRSSDANAVSPKHLDSPHGARTNDSNLGPPPPPANATARMRRKIAKLRKDPRAFFEESRYRPLRAIARFWFDD